MYPSGCFVCVKSTAEGTVQAIRTAMMVGEKGGGRNLESARLVLDIMCTRSTGALVIYIVWQSMHN